MFTNDKIIYENDKTTSKLSDAISTDLKEGVWNLLKYNYLCLFASSRDYKLTW